MDYKILREGAFASIKVKLANGEYIIAEQNSAVVMDRNIILSAHTVGGITKSIYRKLCKESFFMQRLSVPDAETGNILLASKKLGDLCCIKIEKGKEYLIQKDGFLSAEQTVILNMKVQGLIKGMFSGEGYFLIEAKGEGNLIVDSFGKIVKFELIENEELVVNNAHLVAWSKTLSYEIIKAGKGLFSSYFSGAGLACKFTGPGEVYIQTHNSERFCKWMKEIELLNEK